MLCGNVDVNLVCVQLNAALSGLGFALSVFIPYVAKLVQILMCFAQQNLPSVFSTPEANLQHFRTAPTPSLRALATQRGAYFEAQA